MRTPAALTWLCAVALPAALFAATPTTRPEVAQYVATERLISKLGGAGDHEGLHELANLIHARWPAVDTALYGRLIARVCAYLGSPHPTSPAQPQRAREHALIALQRMHLLPTSVVADLGHHVVWGLMDARRGAAEAWPKQRSADMALYFQIWKQVDDAVDPEWDPQRDGPRPVPRPEGARGLSRVAPEQIQDPVAREAYRAALEDNRQRQERSLQQLEARRLQRDFTLTAERLVTAAYSELPADADDLTANPDLFVADVAVRERILGTVRAALAEKEAIHAADDGLSIEERLRRLRAAGQ